MSAGMSKYAPPGLREATDQIGRHRKHVEEFPDCHLCKDAEATEEECVEHGCCRFDCIRTKESSPYFKFIQHGRIPAGSARISDLLVRRTNKEERRMRTALCLAWCEDLKEFFSQPFNGIYSTQTAELRLKINNVYTMRHFYGISENYAGLIAKLAEIIPPDIRPTLQPKSMGRAHRLLYQNQ